MSTDPAAGRPGPADDASRADARVGRRGLIGAVALGGAALGAAAGGGTVWAATREGEAADSPGGAAAAEAAGAAEEAAPPPRRHYRSTMVTAPVVEIETSPGAELAEGYLFLAPRTSIFRGVVLDDTGEPVWIEPDGRAVTDLRVQTYRGEPVLTFWTGLALTGVGEGYGVILDRAYREIARVQCGHGCVSDLHEFQLTPEGTALLVAYRPVPADLTPIGGPADGWIYTNVVQEVDVESGAVLVEWDCRRDLSVEETFEDLSEAGTSPDSPFDAFHVNSVEARGDVLLISARHTHALYAVDRATGRLTWRMGGRRSDVDLPEDAAFSWQHDARFHPDGIVSLFDNHGEIGAKGVDSRGLLLRVDEDQRRAEVVAVYAQEGRFGGAMGNTQVLANGNVLVGWGTARGLTEFGADGAQLLDLRFEGFGSYRAYRCTWRGRPDTAPDVALADDGDGPVVHASWNGATDVASWRVLAAPDDGELVEQEVVARTGFETSVPVPGASRVAVEALDADGAVLGRSRSVRA